LANIITVSRLALLALIVVFLYSGRAPLLWASLVLTVINIAMDGIDGIVARQRGEATKLGSVLDIAIDRVVENVYWVAFVGLSLIPVWIALVVVTRGILTDAVRGYVLSQGDTAFGMMKSPIGSFLVSSRFMRGFYGLAKVVSFAAVIGVFALAGSWTGPDAELWLPRLQAAVYWWVVMTVGITVIRGVPVLWEARRYF
jgi:CDP-diacylglycerol--glycerol-3-phosphate 3-phosphatidyltransferase